MSDFRAESLAAFADELLEVACLQRHLAGHVVLVFEVHQPLVDEALEDRSVGRAVLVLAVEALLYWIPRLAPGALWVPLLLAGIQGVTLAGFIPLTAMMTSVVPLSEKSNAMATYNLAAGLCVFIGAVTYSLLRTALGYGGVVLVYPGFYLLTAVLTHRYLRIRADPGEHRRQS